MSVPGGVVPWLQPCFCEVLAVAGRFSKHGFWGTVPLPSVQLSAASPASVLCGLGLTGGSCCGPSLDPSPPALLGSFNSASTSEPGPSIQLSTVKSY